MVIKRRTACNQPQEEHPSAAMKTGPVLILILVLAASSISPLHGLEMESNVAQVDGCKCLKYTSSFFSPRQIKLIQVIPRGIRCQRPEIIVTTKDDLKVCIYHDAPWMQKLIRHMIGRHRKVTMTRLK